MTSYRDWVVETSSTTGTGAYALSGSAPAGTSYFTFRQRYSNGDDEVCYWVVNADRTKWEKNRFGTLTYGTPDQLSRNVIESTNGDAPVSWTGGDGPLLIYVVPDAAVSDGVIRSWLAEDKDDIPTLLFGPWWKADDIADPEEIEHRLRDNGVTDDGILLGAFNKTARKYIPDAAAINFPPGYISGLTYANAVGDATNDITIAVGACADSTGVYPMVLAAALTKRLDASWAVGDGNGGLDTGSIANTDYYIHLIARSDTGVVDVLFSISATAPTMPADYDYRRLIGWFTRESGSIKGMKITETAGGGIHHIRPGLTLEVTTNALTTSRRSDVMAVPKAFPVLAHVRVQMTDAASNFAAIVCSPDETDVGPDTAGAVPLFNIGAAAGVVVAKDMWVRTSAAGAIAARANLATVDSYQASTLGFIWSRR